MRSARGCSVGPHGPSDEPLHEGACPDPADRSASSATAGIVAEITDEVAMLEHAEQLRAEAVALEAAAARPTRVYLAGPAVDEAQIAAFADAKVKLTAAGYEVFNPVELPEAPSWEARMRQTITWMLVCDGVAQLPRWPGSRSARIEVQLAREIGMPTAWVDVWLHEAAKARRETADGSTG